MSKYLGPKCKLSRREKTDLELKSNIKNIEKKCKFNKIPGDRIKSNIRFSTYNTQLRMKQLIKRYYTLLEKQFYNYYKKAKKKHGHTGKNLLYDLESRLDNIVYRMGFSTTRMEARQIINHKNIMVNNKIVKSPSFHVKKNDIIKVKNIHKRIKKAIKTNEKKKKYSWIKTNYKNFTGTKIDKIKTSELPANFKIHLVIELYSK